jgi:hypothetical protein
MDEEEDTAEFDTKRKIMFMFFRMLNWAMWSSVGYFIYHYYLIRNYDHPE